MWASFFIVWRESVEALLVIGILYAWVKREQNAHEINKIWLGGLLGLLLASALALAILYAGSWYAGSGGEWFLTAMMLVASFLILQMVTWMHHHGRMMKRELEQAAAKAAKGGGFCLMMLAALAVGREGSETVVFLAGTIQQAASLSVFIIGALLGLMGSIITFLLLQIFSHMVPWKWFFRLSAIILLLLGGALLVAASDKMVGQLAAAWEEMPEWAIYVIYEPLWDTSWLLANASGTWAGLVGYHAAPTMSQYLPLTLYWLCAGLFLIRGDGRIRFKQTQPG